jgi:hypothetical protein
MYGPDDGLVEAETCWDYININNEILKINQGILLDFTKQKHKTRIIQNLKFSNVNKTAF